MKINPMTCCDYYKLGHMTMDVPGVRTVVSTWTPRHHKHDTKGNEFTVSFGAQYVVKRYFVEYFKEFFAGNFEDYAKDFERKINATFNPQYVSPIVSAFRELHELGYLPLEVLAVPEGYLIPDGCPQAMIFNTNPAFGWLPQFLEDLWSLNSWLPSTSATTAYYRRLSAQKCFQDYATDSAAVRSLCGDFSMRGMTGHEAAAISGAGHLLSFNKTATIDANSILEQYYGADLERDPPGLGTPSLEHSVVEKGVAYFLDQLNNGYLSLDPKYGPYIQRARSINNHGLPGMFEDRLIAEMAFLIYLLTEVQPTGVFTYVADTYNYWGVLGTVFPVIKDIIMSRNGKIVIRPDSGDPVQVMLGTTDPRYTVSTELSNNSRCIPPDMAEDYGTLRCLYFTFGGEKNPKDKMVLDSHVGVIYGDAITAERQEQILDGAVQLGFSPECIALGIGAYTYQYVTRDTRGYAIKAVGCDIDGLGEIPIFKEPKTDSSKKSQRGAVIVSKDLYKRNRIGWWDDEYSLCDARFSPHQLMRPIFRNGVTCNHESIYQIRHRLWDGKF